MRRGAGRISAAAYDAGRYVDRVLEAASGRRTGREFGEADRAGFSAFALQQALVARIDAARKAGALKDAITKEIGPELARIIVKVIGESLSFRMIARIDAMAAGKNREAVADGQGKGLRARRAGGGGEVSRRAGGAGGGVGEEGEAGVRGRFLLPFTGEGGSAKRSRMRALAAG